MPTPKNRAHSVRKIKHRVPSGQSRVRYRRRVKGKVNVCALSGERLTGVHASRALKPSARRPNRPFGGRLSPSMTKRVITLRARLAAGQISVEEIPLSILPYVQNAKK